jgi:hypothetical protein
MQVFSLLGFTDYEGSDLVGVFGSLDEVLSCVDNGLWYCDSLGYIVSELGQVLDDVLGSVEYVPFKRFSGELVGV